MALYVPLARRRRNAAVASVVTALVGLLVGFAMGRSSAVTAGERAAEVRAAGGVLGTRLEALIIEYEQAVDGTGDSVQGSVLQALSLIEADLDRLIERAPWLGTAQTTPARAATAAVRAAAQQGVAAERFSSVVTSSASIVRATFGG